MSANHDKEVLEFMDLAGVTIKRATDELTALQADRQKAAAMASQTLQLMKQAGLLDKASEKRASALLGSPAGVMELLQGAILAIREQKTAAVKQAAVNQGAGVPDVAAPGGYNSLTDCRVGHRTSEKKASDFAFAERLGVTLGR